MAGTTNLVLLFINYVVLFHFVRSEITNMIDEDVVTTRAYVYWPNATIPFFIDSDHFDQEQSLKIMTALSLFAFKTCLKFAPVMARPEATEHVLILENPTGIRKCTISTEPHSLEEPHKITMGYDCLKSPEIDMMIMKSLGFPFEHNRAVRDLYIDLQPENVEPGYMELFTKDLRLPVELRAIPYDPNSVMHFSERDFSKNGHRTIIFKNRNLRQERFGLSPLDLRKIDVVYGPECRRRDRQDKIELCQNYPGVARRKRDAPVKKSLRVNPDITAPPSVADTAGDAASVDAAVGYTNAVVNELGIEKEVENLVEQVNKVASVALTIARKKLCGNGTKEALRSVASGMEKPQNKLLDIIGDVADYTQNLVEKATQNLTEFCEESKSIFDYQRASCPFFDKNRCTKTYKSTKSGAVKYSTQHRPLIVQSTKPSKMAKKNNFDTMVRSGNNTEEKEVSTNTEKTVVSKENNRRKRDAETTQFADITTPATKTSEIDTTAQENDLRMVNTKLVNTPKSISVPNYTSFNVTNNETVIIVDVRRKRDAVTSTTVKVTTQKLKDKAVDKIKKNKKAKSKKSGKRRFQSQRFR